MERTTNRREARLHRALIVVLAVLLVVPAVVGAASGANASLDAGVEASPLLQPRPSILIDQKVGPTGFILGHNPVTGEPIHNTAMGVRSGNGTASNPYVISNWTIASPASSAIRLDGTGAHVLIKNIYVPGNLRTFVGISLFDVSNVTVENVYIRQASLSGVRVGHATDVEIGSIRIASQLTDHGPEAQQLTGVPEGVVIAHSNRVTLHNATVATATQPLDMERARNVTVRDSSFWDDFRFGTVVPEVELGNTANVSIFRSGVHRIVTRLEGSTRDLTVAGSVFDMELNRSVPGRLGTHVPDFALNAALDPVKGADLCGNTFRATEDDAVELEPAENVRVRGNVFDDTGGAVSLEGSNLSVMKNVMTTGGDVDIAGASVEGTQLHGNAFVNTSFLVRFLGLANATGNWYGASDGPSEDLNGSGPTEDLGGSGASIDSDGFELGSEVLIEPWLSEQPVAGPKAVDCGVPLGEPGVKAPADLVVETDADVSATAQVDEKADPTHVKQRVQASASASVGPVDLPEKTPPPLWGPG